MASDVSPRPERYADASRRFGLITRAQLDEGALQLPREDRYEFVNIVLPSIKP